MSEQPIGNVVREVDILRGVSLVSAPATLPARRRPPPEPDGLQAAEQLAAGKGTMHAVREEAPDPANGRQPAGDEAGHRKTIEDLATRAQQDGFQSGFKRGLEEAERQAAAELLNAKSQLQAQWEKQTAAAAREHQLATQRLSDLADQLSAQFAHRLASCEDDVVELGFSLACAVLGRELVTPDGVKALWARTLQQWNADGELAVRVHPDDLALIAGASARPGERPSSFGDSPFGGANEAEARPSKINWVADERLALGGCLLTSSKGGLDARLTTVLDALKAVLLDVRAKRQVPTDHSCVQDAPGAMDGANRMRPAGLTTPLGTDP